MQHVGDKTKFRITYKHKIGGTKYGSSKSVTTGSFTCRNNGKKTVKFAK